MPLSQLTSSVGRLEPEATLRDAARLMTRESIGSVVICEKAGGPVEGILTDRDIVRALGAGRDPDQTAVATFAARPVETLPEGADVAEIAEAMKQHGVRRVPIVDDQGGVSRIVSLDDLIVEGAAQWHALSQAIQKGFRNEAPEPDPSE